MIQLLLILSLAASSFAQSGPTCANVRCRSNTRCEVLRLPCVDVTCPLQPVCVDVDDSACAAASCLTGTVCRVIAGKVQCVGSQMSSSGKPGSCPVVPPGTVGTCVSMCSNDDSCPNNQKCCSNGCGRVCRNPDPCAICRENERCVLSVPGCVIGQPCPPATAECIDPCDICSENQRCILSTPACVRGQPCPPPTAECIHPCDICTRNQKCVLSQPQCVTAPCPPTAECTDPDPCDSVRCPSGHVCEEVQVQCIRAPCPPTTRCRDPCDICSESQSCLVAVPGCIRGWPCPPPTAHCTDRDPCEGVICGWGDCFVQNRQPGCPRPQRSWWGRILKK